MTLFGSTYVCEQLFSAIKIIKSNHRSKLNDVRLQSCVRVAVLSVSANIDQIDGKEAIPNFSLNNVFPHISFAVFLLVFLLMSVLFL